MLKFVLPAFFPPPEYNTPSFLPSFPVVYVELLVQHPRGLLAGQRRAEGGHEPVALVVVQRRADVRVDVHRVHEHLRRWQVGG